MRTLQRFKKVIRNTLLNLICASFFVVYSISSASATNGQLTGYEYVMYYYSNNIQGTASGYREPTADYYIYNDPSVAKYRGVVEVNFEGPVNGYFCLGLPTTFGSSDVVVVENCVIDHTNNGGIWYFNVNGVDHCTVEYYVQTPSRGLSYLSGEWTAATDLDDINTTLGQIKGYVDGVETSLSNIYTRLGTINTTISAGNTILDKIANLYKLRDSVDIPIYSRFAYINLLRFGELSDQYNYPYSTAQYGFFPTILTNNYSVPSYSSDYDIDVPVGKTLHFIYTISYWANIFDFIDSNSNSLNPNVIMIEGNNYYRSYDVSYTNNTSSRIWLNISMNRNVNRPIIPLYLGVNIPADVAMLFDMDFENTYTRLLQQIATGIGNISQQQIIENNTNINNYNSYQQQINNVENNYYQQFNTVETNIENNNTFDFTGLSTDGVQVYNNLFSNVYGISLVKWPVLITLLGLVIVIILG